MSVLTKPTSEGKAKDEMDGRCESLNMGLLTGELWTGEGERQGRME